MKRSSFILTSGICLLTSGFSLAILDTNNNGLSDFWEREYYAGELFPANFDPQADYDADGWSNDKEAAAGTDPHDPNPPDGIIRPATEHVPAVIGEINGVPGVVSSDSIKVTWPTLTGKQYTLLYSPDLTQGSWLPVGDPVIANGGVNEYVFYEVSANDKCFWRVAVTDVDKDGDGLNNHEEHVFGTNPNLPMTYVNIPDLWLARNFPTIEGFDPNGDPDGDGINNDQENELGLDPNHFDRIGPVNLGFDEEITVSPDMSFREAMFPYPSDLYDHTSIPGWKEKENSNEHDEGWQADTGSHIEIWNEGIAVSSAQQQTEAGSQASSPPAPSSPYVELQSHLGGHGLKQEFNMLPGSRLHFILRYKGRYEYDPYENAFDLKVEGASEMFVDGTPAGVDGNTRSKSFMDDDEWDAYVDWHYAAVSITAETGSSGLKKITLKLVPKTTTRSGENGEEEITYGGFVDFMPVEVIIPKLDSDGNQISGEFVNAVELKVAKWENAFEGNAANGSVKDDFIGWDKDRFYIKITGASDIGIEAINVATEECPDEDYNDDPTRVELAADGFYSISDSMILVSDDQDDDFGGSGAGADDQDGDRTHKVQLGGKFVIKSIFINGTEHNVNLKIPVPAKKEIDIDFYRMIVDNIHALESIEDNAKDFCQKFAQVGLKVNVTVHEVVWPQAVEIVKSENGNSSPPGAFQLYDAFPGLVVGTMTSQYKKFVDEIDSSGVNLYFVGSVFGSNGVAVSLKQIARESNIELKYIDKAFVNCWQLSNTALGGTPVHEAMHILGHKGLNEDDHDQVYSNILFSGNLNSNPVLYSKRINSLQEKTIYNHNEVKDPAQ